jgi:hypothetical protein
LVGAELAGDATGEVTAGSLAVVPISSEQAARPNSAAATGTMSDSFLSMRVLISSLGLRELRDVSRSPVNAAAGHKSVTATGRGLPETGP